VDPAHVRCLDSSRGRAAGEHEEAGINIVTAEGLFVINTPSLYEIARALGVNHHDAWRAYRDFAHMIVEDHNAAPGTAVG